MCGWKPSAKGFQGGRIIGQLVKCYHQARVGWKYGNQLGFQVIEHVDPKPAIGFNNVEITGDLNKDSFGGMVGVKA